MTADHDHLHERRGARENAPLKAIALSVLSLLLLIITVFGALALPLSISSPTSVYEGQPISVALSGPGTLFISRSGVVVATGTGSIADVLATTSSSAGLYSYSFASDAPGQVNETRSVEVLDVPLNIVITSPMTTDLQSGDVTFSLSTNWQPELCYVNINGVGHALTAENGTSFTGTFAVPDGAHVIEYKCKLGSELASASKSIHVDKSPPVVSAVSPSGDVRGPFVTLTVDTDEIAKCRFGTSDAEYGALPSAMSATYALRNTATVDINSYGSYTYFVRCEDVTGNVMASSSIISFLNKLPPTATISVDGKTPLRAQTYKLFLKTSLPLASAPTLSYTFQESGRTQQVILGGNGDSWSGYMIVPDGIADTIASFAFSGTSTQGIAGTEILDGGVFTIDAKPPAMIDTIFVDNVSSYIKLKWSSTIKQDAVTYNVYRSSKEGVTYADLYATASATEFTDTNAMSARYYYYRVAAVDAAGNLGPLSSEVYGSAIDQALRAEPSSIIDPMIAAKLDEEIAALASAIMDANQTAQTLAGESNAVSIRIIKDMRLVENARSGLLDLGAAKLSLEDLRARAPTSAEADEAIARSRATVDTVMKSLVRRIMANEQTETKQPSDVDGLSRSLPYALTGNVLSASERNAYLKRSIELQDKMTVGLSAMTFTLYDGNGAGTGYTFIRKTIALQDPVNDVLIIESIPKSVAKDAADITFENPPTVLEADPVVQYSFPVLEREEYSYYLKSIISLDEVKKSRTFVYPKLSTGLPSSTSSTVSSQGAGQSKQSQGSSNGSSDDQNLVTGQVTRVGIPLIGDASATDALLMVFGVVIIIGLLAYYISMSSDQRPFRGYPSQVAVPVPRSSVAWVPTVGAGASQAQYGPRRFFVRTQPVTQSAARTAASTTAVSSRILPSGPLSSSQQKGFSPSVVRSATSHIDGADAKRFDELLSSLPDIEGPAREELASSPGVLSDEMMRAILRDAEARIDGKEYDAALELYRKAVFVLQNDAGLQQVLHDEMMVVYTKLLLFKRLADAHAAIDGKDLPGARHALDDVRTLAMKVGEQETILINEAKASYALCVRTMNALEISGVKEY